MIWNHFFIFSLSALILWTIGSYAAWKGKSRRAVVFTICGLCVFLAFIILLWAELRRPPLRTMGETRMWYAFFLPLAGLIVYGRWHYKWLLSFSTLMSLVFICINILKPEIHSKSLMPALQSPWFAPHVIVYMLAYALYGAATMMALYLLFIKKSNASPVETATTDNLVSVGFCFMTLGILMGALWAKEAWGHYWSWDPKETWAAASWFSYLIYIHYRKMPSNRLKIGMWILVINFVLLQMCWWGVNYLPSAQGVSIHTYNMD
ncbi:MAG: cytochrome c biogenesis protein CcsA [Prevotella sp.]|jgi:ABC-type transport system involved in cytochrome c biogenesis permease subunit